MSRRIPAHVLAAGALLSLTSLAHSADPAETAARRLLSDRLLNDARASARAAIPAPLSARQAMRVLQAARNVSPDSLDILRALAEAASESREREVFQQTLRDIVRLDPGDLVAQANLITVMAESTQALDEQSAVYAAALQKEALDPQVRSEIALRYARLHLQRGGVEEARKLLDTAVKLNDVNAGAWEEIIRLQATGPVRVSDRMAAIVSCLMANPYLPQTWIAGGRALAATNQHDLAAQFLGTALDQAYRVGASRGPLLLEWATEVAITGDPRAEIVLSQLAKLDDAPLNALLTSLSVSGPSLTAASPGVDPLVTRIRARVAETIKAAPENREALADAAWIEIFYLPDIAPAATDYLDRFAKLVGENEDAVKVRRGWLLLRQGKLTEASALLAPIGGKDPFAELGLARIAAAQNDLKTATANLQDIYNAHPTGLLALQVMLDARKHKITLKETSLGEAVRKAAAGIPSSVFSAQVSPRDLMLMVPSFPKRKYGFAEPVVLSIKVTNTTDRALSVGGAGGGAVKSSIGLLGTLKEPVQQTLGLYAIDNSPRVFRIAPRAAYTLNLRVDQDRIYDTLVGTAFKPFAMSVSLMTDPLLTRDGVLPGVGGQALAAGEFVREAVQMPKLEDAAKVADALPALPPDRQMITGLVLAQLLPELTDEKIGTGAGAESARLARTRIADALAKVTAADSPIVKAWFLRMVAENPPEPLAGALKTAALSNDPTPRLVGIWRLYSSAHPATDADRAALRAQLMELAAGEKGRHRQGPRRHPRPDRTDPTPGKSPRHHLRPRVASARHDHHDHQTLSRFAREFLAQGRGDRHGPQHAVWFDVAAHARHAPRRHRPVRHEERHVVRETLLSDARHRHAALDVILKPHRSGILARRLHPWPADVHPLMLHRYAQADTPKVRVLDFLHPPEEAREMHNPGHVRFRKGHAMASGECRQHAGIIEGGDQTPFAG